MNIQQLNIHSISERWTDVQTWNSWEDVVNSDWTITNITPDGWVHIVHRDGHIGVLRQEQE